MRLEPNNPILYLALAGLYACSPYASCDQGCEADEVGVYGSHQQCVPAPDADGACPEGTTYEACYTGSCPTCRDCVEACIPDEWR